MSNVGRRRPFLDEFIHDVVDGRLCTGCGTCVGVCPKQALRMEMTERGTCVPRVIFPQNCTMCGVCADVCPVNNDGYAKLNQAVFGKIPQDRLLGNYIECYRGYSADPEIRWRATSGGVVTSLLLFLLKEKYIDGALVTRMAKGDPLKGEAFIARTEGEILSAVGSKYVPIPVNEMLSEISSQAGRFAVVGLPCHIEGIRRAELRNANLQQRIVCRFGLVCSHTIGFQGVEYVLRRMGISRCEVAELKFRGEGWPGGLRALLKDGSTRRLPTLDSWWSEVYGGFFFGHRHCLWCTDVLNELADISFADAWLPDVVGNDRIGTSVMMVRTERGEHLLDAAVNGNRIQLSALKASEALRSQLFMTLFKKRNIRARLVLARLFGMSFPGKLRGSSQALLPPTHWDYLTALVPYLNISVSWNRLFRRFLEHIPFQIIRRYRMRFKQCLMHRAHDAVEHAKRKSGEMAACPK